MIQILKINKELPKSNIDNTRMYIKMQDLKNATEKQNFHIIFFEHDEKIFWRAVKIQDHLLKFQNLFILVDKSPRRTF